MEIPFVAGQRNRPAALFLESLGARTATACSGFRAEAAAACGYSAAISAAASRPQRPRPPRGPHEASITSKIATELRDPAAILERIRARYAARRRRRALARPPRTPLERELAELWAGLLNVPAVGIHDNFFELGGHSLLAVQLLSRVRQIYGVELSLEVVYSGEFTVAELAKAIELKEIEQAGGDYQESACRSWKACRTKRCGRCWPKSGSSAKRMRILLTANASYVPPRGGATRSNLVWLNHLASAGHECRIVCGPPARRRIAAPPRHRHRCRGRSGAARAGAAATDSRVPAGLGAGVVRGPGPRAAARGAPLGRRAAWSTWRTRRSSIPFGPASWNPDPHAAELVARSAGIVAIGRHMADYIERELGRRGGGDPSADLRRGAVRQLRRTSSAGLIAMINPCAVKGISIFLATAERLPEYEFGVVPGWGTTAADRRALERLPNVRFLPNVQGHR